MAKDKSEKREKHEKKEKRSEKDGVHKSKKDKKDKKDKTVLSDSVLKGIEQEISANTPVNGIVKTDEDAIIDRPVGALVPFARPLLEDKQAKKALKSVKKGKLRPLFFSASRTSSFGMHLIIHLIFHCSQPFRSIHPASISPSIR
jgi:H/ACA ribonucleoprotein complex subunit 2